MLPPVEGRREASGRLLGVGDAVVVKRGHPRLLVMSCPDGCGEELTINLDPRAGQAWKIYGSGRALTLFPSVWRESGCESHFIIWAGRIYLFGAFSDDDPDDWMERAAGDPSEANILSELSPNEYQGAADIADRIGALPWDVLVGCRRLVKAGLAVEGHGMGRGRFRRA